MKEKNWFTKEPQEVEAELKTNLKNGLTDEEARKRIEQYGLNQLQTKKKKSLVQKFLEQFKDFSIILPIAISSLNAGIITIDFMFIQFYNNISSILQFF